MNNIEFGKRFQKLAEEYHLITGKLFDTKINIETDKRTHQEILDDLQQSVENAQIAVAVVEKINQLPIGSEFTISQLVQQKHLQSKDLFEITKLVRDILKDKIERPQKYVNAVVGLPYHIPFVKIK